jgi:beta-carotene 3-hydroxylase
MLLYILTVASVFLLMEGVAWATHKYIMHGFLWTWHKSHHHPYDGFFEKNDLFSIVFSIPSITLFVCGMVFSNPWCYAIGAGILAYGIFYVIFHDIIVHRRIKLKYKATSAYMKRLIRAHKIHHKTQTKEHAEAFGFLFAPAKYAVRDKNDLQD